MKKNYRIAARVDYETKIRFSKKCRDAGISETQMIEKIANEPTIFIDKNVKVLLNYVRQNDGRII